MDIPNGVEEIATQALKCLGFMIYHPSVVNMLTGNDANMIVEMLEKAITTTKIKVAWERLIDALIQPPKQFLDTNRDHSVHQVRTSEENDSESEVDKLVKRIKLIMTPITGVLSSKCEMKVYLSCLNTWCYLLHKLDASVNCTSVVKLVWEPIFEVVFQVIPDNKNTVLMNICLNLLDNFALARSKNLRDDSNNQLSCPLSGGTPMIGLLLSGESSWKHYPVRWFPWDLTQLEFILKMVHNLFSCCSVNNISPEIKSLCVPLH